MMPERFATVDRGDNQLDGCGVVYNQEIEARERALRDWNFEVIAMVIRHNNLRYYKEYTGSNEVVYI
jgi:hypothetical protein